MPFIWEIPVVFLQVMTEHEENSHISLPLELSLPPTTKNDHISGLNGAGCLVTEALSHFHDDYLMTISQAVSDRLA